MSNAGQIALIVVGTVIGAYFGNPELGFVLGSLAGNALFPTQLPHGPQLTDNRTTTASVGDPVPILFGTADVAGTVIWLAPFTQTSVKSSSKGGPQQTTYQYNQSIAIGLCEGPIGGLSRVWENGTIVYDIRPQQKANVDLNLLAETDLEYANRLTVSAAYAETFTLYLGGEDQEADPTIEAVQGMGQVPAFRGLAYIVYPNRLLQTGQAWRHPSFRFEVYAAGLGACTNSSGYSNSYVGKWNTQATDPRSAVGTYSYQYVLDGTNAGPTRTTLAQAVGDAFVLGGTYNTVREPVTLASDLLGWNAPQSNGQVGVGPQQWDQLAWKDPASLLFYYNQQNPAWTFFDVIDTTAGDIAICNFLVPYPGAWWVGSRKVSGVVDYGSHGTYTCTIDEGSDPPACLYPYLPDNFVEVARLPGPPPPPCYGLPAVPVDPLGSQTLANYCKTPAGEIISGSDWVLDTSHTYKVLQAFVIDGELNVASYPLNPCLPVGSPDDNEAFWTAAYVAAVAANTMPPGMTYLAETAYPIPGVAATVYPVLQGSAYTNDMQTCTGLGGKVTVASIIAAICARAGLTQVDVSQLVDVSIPGYAIASVSSATSIITPLRSVAFFDAVETAGELLFAARGKPIVATLTTDDIGAYDAGAGKDDKVPASITTVRAQDVDLPLCVRFKYRAVSRDYEDGEEDSPFRLSSTAVNLVDVQSPLCLGDTQAAQAVEVIWADAWAARTSYTLCVDQSWLALDCGDCIGVPVDGVLQRMRIVSETTSAGVLRKLSCVRDDSGAYISFAVSTAPLRAPQVLSFIAPSSYELLDLPALADSDNNAGFYIVAQRQAGGGKWNGAFVYQSLDGGLTYTQLLVLSIEATLGALAAPVLASQAYTWDDVTTLTVNVPNATVSFESVTDAALLAGANAVAMGADGRWEIVQFATATKVSDTQWTLSRLLRGRRGTEHVMGTSVTGDTVVLLSSGDLGRIALQQTQIGALLAYKVVSNGSSYASGVNQSFAGHAQALFPFSPVALKAAAQANGDTLLTWIRRGRIGGTLASGVDVPLSEATEAYQVDILNGAAVVRTLAVTAQSATYTAADQVADFGAGSALTEISVAVYQMSAVVGRGTPAIGTLPITPVPTSP